MLAAESAALAGTVSAVSLHRAAASLPATACHACTETPALVSVTLVKHNHLHTFILTAKCCVIIIITCAVTV